jgi:predicted MFS family arabinose efflux permease
MNLALHKPFEGYRAAFRGLTRETWLLAGVMLVNRAGTMAVPFMGMYVTQSLNGSLSQAGIVVTLYGVGSIVGSASGGWLTDRFGFRPVQIVTSLLAGGLFLLFPLVVNFHGLCLLTVALSMVAEAFRPANHAAIAAYAGKARLMRSYSLNRFAINLGWSIGGSLGGWVAGYDYRLLFAIEGAANIAAAALILFLLPASPAPLALDPGPHRMMPWRDRTYVHFLILCTGFTVFFMLIFRLVPVYWKDVCGLSEREIGLVLGLNGLLIAMFEMNLVHRLEHANLHGRLLFAACWACAVGYAVLFFAPHAAGPLAVVCMFLVTLSEMLALPVISDFVMRRANEHNRGQYAAGQALTWSIAAVIGPLLGALLADHGGYSSLWVSAMATLVLCGWGFRRLIAREQASTTSPSS